MLGNLAHTPERSHAALLEAVTQRGDALGGEPATAILVDTAELVLIQTAANGSPDIQSVIRGAIAQLPNLGWKRT